jgi:hypothetical protein
VALALYDGGGGGGGGGGEGASVGDVYGDVCGDVCGDVSDDVVSDVDSEAAKCMDVEDNNDSLPPPQPAGAGGGQVTYLSNPNNLLARLSYCKSCFGRGRVACGGGLYEL